MMKLLRKYGRLGAAGLSLVELIISMAILAVVGTAIGGAMYVSSKSYSTGSAEVNVQEEAQVASNLICDWLVDATAVNPGSGSVDLGAGESFVVVHPDGDSEVQITIALNSSNELTYNAVKKVPGASDQTFSGVLAANVTGCVFNSSFDDNRNVQFLIDFMVNERTYHAVTDSTSRNQDFIAETSTMISGLPVIKFDLPYDAVNDTYFLYLEPGQNESNHASFKFYASVFNCDPDDGVFAFGHDGATTGADTGDSTWLKSMERVGTTNQYEITACCGNYALNGSVITFSLSDTNGSTSEKVTISIRRATECTFSVDNAILESGNAGKAHAVYKTVTLSLGDHCYPKHYTGFDSGIYSYKDASQVQYFYRYYDTATHSYKDASSYVNATEVTSMYADPYNPVNSVKIELTNDLPGDLYVIAVAVHSGSHPGGAAAYGIPAITADNKVTAINASAPTPFVLTYTGAGAGNVAYWDYFKIAADNTPDPYVPSNSGFRRGTPSFEAFRTNQDYLDDLQTRLEAMFPGENFKTKCFYYSAIEYRVAGSSDPWSTYVIARKDEWSNLTPSSPSNTAGHEFVQMDAAESVIFEPDKEYDYRMVFACYKKVDDGHGNVTVGDEIETTYSAYAKIPACVPYVYSPSTGIFALNSYGKTTPFKYVNRVDVNNGNLLGLEKPNMFLVYFNNMNVANGYDFGFRLEKRNGSDWVRVLSSADSHYPTAVVDSTMAGALSFMQGYENAGQIRDLGSWATGVEGFTSTDTIMVGTEAHNIGGYDENDFGNSDISVQAIKLGNGNMNFTNNYTAPIDGSNPAEGVDYRIVFDGNFKYASSIYPGHIGANTNYLGTVTTATKTFNLTGIDLSTSTEYGYIYIDVQ